MNTTSGGEGGLVNGTYAELQCFLPSDELRRQLSWANEQLDLIFMQFTKAETADAAPKDLRSRRHSRLPSGLNEDRLQDILGSDFLSRFLPHVVPHLRRAEEEGDDESQETVDQIHVVFFKCVKLTALCLPFCHVGVLNSFCSLFSQAFSPGIDVDHIYVNTDNVVSGTVFGQLRPEFVEALELRNKVQKRRTTLRAFTKRSMDLVGRCVKHIWENTTLSYCGMIVDYNQNTRQHLIHYVDGEKQWTVLEALRGLEWLKDKYVKASSRNLEMSANDVDKVLQVVSKTLRLKKVTYDESLFDFELGDFEDEGFATEELLTIRAYDTRTKCHLVLNEEDPAARPRWIDVTQDMVPFAFRDKSVRKVVTEEGAVKVKCYIVRRKCSALGLVKWYYPDPAKRLKFHKSDKGLRIKIWWPGEKQWFKAIVRRFVPPKSRDDARYAAGACGHLLKYDDGDKKWYPDISQRDYVILIETKDRWEADSSVGRSKRADLSPDASFDQNHAPLFASAAYLRAELGYSSLERMVHSVEKMRQAGEHPQWHSHALDLVTDKMAHFFVDCGGFQKLVDQLHEFWSLRTKASTPPQTRSRRHSRVGSDGHSRRPSSVDNSFVEQPQRSRRRSSRGCAHSDTTAKFASHLRPDTRQRRSHRRRQTQQIASATLFSGTNLEKFRLLVRVVDTVIDFVCPSFQRLKLLSALYTGIEWIFATMGSTSIDSCPHNSLAKLRDIVLHADRIQRRWQPDSANEPAFTSKHAWEESIALQFFTILIDARSLELRTLGVENTYNYFCARIIAGGAGFESGDFPDWDRATTNTRGADADATAGTTGVRRTTIDSATMNRAFCIQQFVAWMRSSSIFDKLFDLSVISRGKELQYADVLTASRGLLHLYFYCSGFIVQCKAERHLARLKLRQQKRNRRGSSSGGGDSSSFADRSVTSSGSASSPMRDHRVPDDEQLLRRQVAKVEPYALVKNQLNQIWDAVRALSAPAAAASTIQVANANHSGDEDDDDDEAVHVTAPAPGKPTGAIEDIAVILRSLYDLLLHITVGVTDRNLFVTGSAAAQAQAYLESGPLLLPEILYVHIIEFISELPVNAWDAELLRFVARFGKALVLVDRHFKTQPDQLLLGRLIRIIVERIDDHKPTGYRLSNNIVLQALDAICTLMAFADSGILNVQTLKLQLASACADKLHANISTVQSIVILSMVLQSSFPRMKQNAVQRGLQEGKSATASFQAIDSDALRSYEDIIRAVGGYGGLVSGVLTSFHALKAEAALRLQSKSIGVVLSAGTPVQAQGVAIGGLGGMTPSSLQPLHADDVLVGRQFNVQMHVRARLLLLSQCVLLQRSSPTAGVHSIKPLLTGERIAHIWECTICNVFASEVQHDVFRWLEGLARAPSLSRAESFVPSVPTLLCLLDQRGLDQREALGPSEVLSFRRVSSSVVDGVAAPPSPTRPNQHSPIGAAAKQKQMKPFRFSLAEVVKAQESRRWEPIPFRLTRPLLSVDVQRYVLHKLCAVVTRTSSAVPVALASIFICFFLSVNVALKRINTIFCSHHHDSTFGIENFMLVPGGDRVANTPSEHFDSKRRPQSPRGAAKSMSSRSHVRTAFTRRTLEVEAFKHLEQLYLKVTELDVAAEDAFSSVITDLVTNISDRLKQESCSELRDKFLRRWWDSISTEAVHCKLSRSHNSHVIEATESADCESEAKTEHHDGSCNLNVSSSTSALGIVAKSATSTSTDEKDESGRNVAHPDTTLRLARSLNVVFQFVQRHRKAPQDAEHVSVICCVESVVFDSVFNKLVRARRQSVGSLAQRSTRGDARATTEGSEVCAPAPLDIQNSVDDTRSRDISHVSNFTIHTDAILAMALQHAVIGEISPGDHQQFEVPMDIFAEMVGDNVVAKILSPNDLQPLSHTLQNSSHSVSGPVDLATTLSGALGYVSSEAPESFGLGTEAPAFDPLNTDEAVPLRCACNRSSPNVRQVFLWFGHRTAAVNAHQVTRTHLVEHVVDTSTIGRMLFNSRHAFEDGCVLQSGSSVPSVRSNESFATHMLPESIAAELCDASLSGGLLINSPLLKNRLNSSLRRHLDNDIDQNLQNVVNYESLYQLMLTAPLVVTAQVWDLLHVLPADPILVKRILHVRDVAATGIPLRPYWAQESSQSVAPKFKIAWPTIFSATNCFKLIYALELMDGAISDSSTTVTSATQWCQCLAHHGFWDYVVEMTLRCSWAKQHRKFLGANGEDQAAEQIMPKHDYIVATSCLGRLWKLADAILSLDAAYAWRVRRVQVFADPSLRGIFVNNSSRASVAKFCHCILDSILSVFLSADHSHWASTSRNSGSGTTTLNFPAEESLLDKMCIVKFGMRIVTGFVVSAVSSFKLLFGSYSRLVRWLREIYLGSPDESGVAQTTAEQRTHGPSSDASAPPPTHRRRHSSGRVHIRVRDTSTNCANRVNMELRSEVTRFIIQHCHRSRGDCKAVLDITHRFFLQGLRENASPARGPTIDASSAPGDKSPPLFWASASNDFFWLYCNLLLCYCTHKSHVNQTATTDSDPNKGQVSSTLCLDNLQPDARAFVLHLFTSIASFVQRRCHTIESFCTADLTHDFFVKGALRVLELLLTFAPELVAGTNDAVTSARDAGIKHGIIPDVSNSQAPELTPRLLRSFLFDFPKPVAVDGCGNICVPRDHASNVATEDEQPIFIDKECGASSLRQCIDQVGRIGYCCKSILSRRAVFGVIKSLSFPTTRQQSSAPFTNAVESHRNDGHLRYSRQDNVARQTRDEFLLYFEKHLPELQHTFQSAAAETWHREFAMARLMQPTRSKSVGLRNLGSTCYLNSFVQLMFHCPSVKHIIFSINTDKTLLESRTEAVASGTAPSDVDSDTAVAAAETKFIRSKRQAFQLLIACMSACPTNVLDTSFICSLLQQADKHHTANVFGSSSQHASLRHSASQSVLGDVFTPSQQRDVHEFATEFLDLFSTSTYDNQTFSTSDNVSGETQPSLQNLFGGRLRHSTQSLNGHHLMLEKETFSTISLDIENHSTLESALKGFVSFSALDGANKVQFEGVSHKSRATRQTVFDELPREFILLHLKRFKFEPHTMSFEKISSRCSFPDVIDLAPYTAKAFPTPEARPRNQHRRVPSGAEVFGTHNSWAAMQNVAHHRRNSTLTGSTPRRQVHRRNHSTGSLFQIAKPKLPFRVHTAAYVDGEETDSADEGTWRPGGTEDHPSMRHQNATTVDVNKVESAAGKSVFSASESSGAKPQRLRKQLFELVGVIVHDGSYHSGHYYTFLLSDEKSLKQPSLHLHGQTPSVGAQTSNNANHFASSAKWTKFNDDRISYVSRAELSDLCFGIDEDESVGLPHESRAGPGRSCCAYMLLYRRASRGQSASDISVCRSLEFGSMSEDSAEPEDNKRNQEQRHADKAPPLPAESRQAAVTLSEALGVAKPVHSVTLDVSLSSIESNSDGEGHECDQSATLSAKCAHRNSEIASRFLDQYWLMHKHVFFEYTLYDPSLRDFLWELLCRNQIRQGFAPVEKLRNTKILTHAVLCIVWTVTKDDLSEPTAACIRTIDSRNRGNKVAAQPVCNKDTNDGRHIDMHRFAKRIRRWTEGLVKVFATSGDEAAQWFLGTLIDHSNQHNYTLLHLLTCPYSIVRDEFAALVYFSARIIVTTASKKREARRFQTRNSSSRRSSETVSTTANDRNVVLFNLSRLMKHLVNLLPVVGEDFAHQSTEYFRLLHRVVQLCRHEPRAIKFLISSGSLEALVQYFCSSHERITFDPITHVPLGTVPVPNSRALFQTIFEIVELATQSHTDGLWDSPTRAEHGREATLSRVCHSLIGYNAICEALRIDARRTAKLFARLCCYQHSSTFTESPVSDEDADGHTFTDALVALRQHCIAPKDPITIDRIEGLLLIFAELLIVNGDVFSGARVAAILESLDAVVREMVTKRMPLYELFVERVCGTVFDLALQYSHIRNHLVFGSPKTNEDEREQLPCWKAWLQLFRVAQSQED